MAFSFETSGLVRLAVLDVLGREVAVLVDGVRPAGEQEASWDAARAAPGVYVLRLEADSAVLTRTVTVAR